MIEGEEEFGFSYFCEVLETSQKERKPDERKGEVDWSGFIERGEMREKKKKCFREQRRGWWSPCHRPLEKVSTTAHPRPFYSFFQVV